MVEHDIAIAGGGPVGCALALALAREGRKVALFEPRAAAAPAGDARPIALSYGSRLILERLGVWASLTAATAIMSVHVSQRGGWGRVELTAADAGLPALGYVTDYDALRTALDRAVACAAVERFETAVAAARPCGDVVEVEARDTARPARARLLVCADGGGLAADIVPRKVRDYRQCAVVGLIGTDTGHRGRAFERFAERGPIALLPYGKDYALVWTVDKDVASALLELSPAGFLARLQRDFGGAAGCFTSVSARAAYPLSLKFATRLTAPRLAVVGNAAQTLHPVAGQGFNLGLRDAWELARQVAAGDDPGEPKLLAGYAAARRADRWSTIGFTDSLVRIFTLDSELARIARGAAMVALGGMPFARRFVARRMIFGARG